MSREARLPRLPEIAWGWPEIAVILAWRLAPNGYVILKEDLISLPTDRVLMEERKPERLTLAFIPIARAVRLMDKARGTQAATTSELQGRWQKIAVTTAWHFARRRMLGKFDSITLTEYDRQAVPSDLTLMASGHSQGVEWRFLPHAEAARLAAWDREHEGIMVQEKTQL